VDATSKLIAPLSDPQEHKSFLEMTLTGLRIITFDRRRFLATLAGIAMAVIILFVEQGFFFAIVDTQVKIAEVVRGHLIVLHKARTNLSKWTRFDAIRLTQAMALQPVQSAYGLYQGTAYFAHRSKGEQRRILVYAMEPDAIALETGASPSALAALRTHGTLLFDRLSRDLYGDVQVGQNIYINDHPFHVGGTIALGPNVIHDGAVLMSTKDWLRLSRYDTPIMGVIQLRAGVSVSRAAEEIQAALPDDVVILTPRQLRWREFIFTMRAAPIGLLFAIGFLAGIAVGTGVCTQTLYNEVHDRRAQYATLKAMGFSRKFLVWLVSSQSLVLAAGGFILGVFAVLPIFAYIAALTSLPLELTFSRVVFVAIVACAMSLLAAGLAMHKVAKSDPASLY
jgi:putative ABC transport system permease protein